MKLFNDLQLAEKVLPLEQFDLFCNDQCDPQYKINPNFVDSVIKAAEVALITEMKPLTASLYREFSLNGNRVNYENPYFERRNLAFLLMMGELATRSGKYINKLIDVVWAILEETTWVIPAHNNPLDTSFALPYTYKQNVDYIDLFSAETGALLALIHHFLKNDLEKALPTLINDRILYELDRRIFAPFLTNSDNWWWTGFTGRYVNNWNPWIVTNVMTACAVCQTDIDKRINITEQSVQMIENYIKFCEADGACIEGAGYWAVSSAALYNYLEVLYDITDGKINLFHHPLIRGMGDYFVKMNIAGSEFINFADCSRMQFADYKQLYRWGNNTNSKLITDFAAEGYKKSFNLEILDQSRQMFMLYNRMRHYLSLEEPAGAEYKHEDCYYIESLQIMSARGFSNSGRKLFYAIKGGTNGESHGHNDVGHFLVYVDDNPLFIDLGVNDYTKDTFSDNRYSIWTMQSHYHSTPILNGFKQPAGSYFATDVNPDKENKTISMNLKKAYPAEAGIKSAIRIITMSKSDITITDLVSLEQIGENTFNLMSAVKPLFVKEGALRFHLDDGGEVLCEYSKGFDYSVEEIDVTSTKIGREWKRDTLFRITLTALFQNGKLELKINV